jgi:hypothetical protein
MGIEVNALRGPWPRDCKERHSGLSRAGAARLPTMVNLELVLHHDIEDEGEAHHAIGRK